MLGLEMSSYEKFVLDTHAWIWIAEGVEELLGSTVIKKIEKASEESLLYVAAISLWEVGMLKSKGRIRFTVPCIQWVLNALKAPGLSVTPLDPYIALESSRLPGDFHGDPADRLIIATARKLDATLVTRDTAILQYSDQGYLKAIKI